VGQNRNWSSEEVAYLEEKWGVLNRQTIAEKLNRPESGVQQKAQRLGLGDALTHIDGITVSQLSQVIHTHYGLLKNWIKKYDFPAKRKRLTAHKNVLYVRYDDFWKWAEQNKQMIDFSRFDRLALSPEPEWVEKKRAADFKKKQYLPKPHNAAWSDNDIAKLKWLVQKPTMTYPELSKELRRTHGAIKRKLNELDIRFRPAYLTNHNPYSEKEEALLESMMLEGHSFIDIAFTLNRSEAGVRGKAERMGYTFKNGVPSKETS
jgi:hypothetical protein